MEVAPPPLGVESFLGGLSAAGGTNGGASSSSSSSRYETLLQQIVQLNTDLQKTVALSQSLQRERDGLQANNHKLKDEAKRVHDRCEKLQLVLMQETEHRIEADKKHEELIAKWKKQLEVKAKAFESLQQKLAPPRDLDQLRIQIQAELEEPHQQRIHLLQQDVEKHRQHAFGIRRDYEVLKTEYEQFAVDQGNEMETLQATYEMKLSELQRKLRSAEQVARDAQSSDTVRKLEQQRNAAHVEVKLLHDEVRDVRDELKRYKDQAASERGDLESRLAEELARNANSDLDLKAMARQLARVKDEHEGLRAKWDHAQTKLLELANESDRLRDQLKQKEQLVLNSHQAVAAKLREERDAWERERSAMKDHISELSSKLHAAESALASHRPAPRHDGDENADHSVLAAQLKAREGDVEKYRQLAAAMESKVAEKEDELRAVVSDHEDAIHRLKSEQDQLKHSIHALEMERAQLLTKQSTTQELLSKMKAECMTLRAKLKETEMDYRTLQAKHRETIQLHEDIELEKEQMETKLKFAETDCQTLREKLEKEREDHAHTERELQHQLNTVEHESRSQKEALRDDAKAALSKALRELSRVQKKRDAFKQKCLNLHAQHKLLLSEMQLQDAELLQLKHDHAAELQHVLAQLAQVENDKTALLQRHLQS